MKRSWLTLIVLLLVGFGGPLAFPAGAQAVIHPHFDLSAPTGGPFPSDRFTVPDSSQNTGRRINLPKPDIAVRPSDCADLDVLNTLDGFNVQPRLSIPFSGPIDLTTVNSNTVFLVKLKGPIALSEAAGGVIGINQIVWDATTNTLHVESDALLEQHTRYALVVTRGVRAISGEPVEPSEEFARFRHDLNPGQTQDPALHEYRLALLQALEAVEGLGIAPKSVAVASVFSTMSVTATLEKIRDQIHANTPAPADFVLGFGGTRTVFDLGGIAGITFNRQTRVIGSLSPIRVPIELLNAVPNAVGAIAFGRYSSPDYQVHPGEFIPTVATRTGTPVVQSMNDVYFNLFLPKGPMPVGGWPVAMVGHGSLSNKNDEVLRVAAVMASHGIATLAINTAGYGFGPQSTLTVNQTSGSVVTFPAGGRSVDQNGDSLIGANEGQLAAAPRTTLGETDALRQTTADLMQLVRVIQAGIDVDGDGVPDLNRSRIYHAGFSLGASPGMMLFAVEPGLRAAAFIVPLGSRIETLRLGSVARPEAGGLLAARTPSLLNSPGIANLGGLTIAAPWFNETMPLRDGVPLAVGLTDGTIQVLQSPLINAAPGAIEIQRVFENRKWVSQTANPVAFAPHIRKDPLQGVPARPVLFQFAFGDQISPNPTNAAILRAGDLADRATLYRNDLAYAENPAVPKNPHQFRSRIDSPVPLVREIAFGAQNQFAAFLASDGAVITHPEPYRLFEGIFDLAPFEYLNFIP